MKLPRIPSLLLAAMHTSVALAVFALPAYSATMFTEDFSDNSAGPNMTLGTGFGSPTTDFTGDFTVTSGTNSRIYLGTNDTDYNTINFMFEATVYFPVTDDWTSAYIGMGTTTPAGKFGEPSFPGIYSLVLPRTNSLALSRDGSTADDIVSNIWTPGMGSFADTTHRLRMEWNATTQKAVFQLDQNNNGVWDFTSPEIDGSDNGFTASNSRLFLGGGNGVTFDNISIVPEPSAALLGGLGALLLLRRRR